VSKEDRERVADSPESLSAGSLSFDRVARDYDRTRGYPDEVSAAIAKGMIEHGPLPPGTTALEIGIGTGRIALPLLERGVNVTGVDISARMTDILRAKYGAQRASQPARDWGALVLRLANSAHLPFADASFDAAIAVHVLHLISDWRAALRETLRTLRPGAPLLLGQDMSHGSPIAHPMQEEWARIITNLGYEPKRLGAARFTDILSEARAMGQHIEEWTLAEWSAPRTPAEGFADIADRLWSLTWQAPEPYFSESVRQLEQWARGRYGARWDQPEPVDFSFRLARMTRHTS
jgi:ubiquinone/menaquinone biosynthesis C-methylase UbiE